MLCCVCAAGRWLWCPVEQTALYEPRHLKPDGIEFSVSLTNPQAQDDLRVQPFRSAPNHRYVGLFPSLRFDSVCLHAVNE